MLKKLILKKLMLKKPVLKKSMLHKSMLHKFGMILLPLCISVLLSGCLVDKKTPRTISLTGTNLRTYQNADYINYTVTANDVNGSRSGTLQIKWETPSQTIIDPISSTSYLDTLKETTTLTLNDEDPDELVRYTEQDSNGSMYLRAFDTTDINKYYWLSPDLSVTSDILQEFEIFRSPLAEAGQIDLGRFYVQEDCTGTGCASSVALSDSRTFEVTITNQTLEIPGIGIFTNVYQVQYNATTTPQATSPLLDILNVCADAGNTTTHMATLYVVPEIGIIRTVNTCTDQVSGYSSIHIINLDTTSFPF